MSTSPQSPDDPIPALRQRIEELERRNELLSDRLEEVAWRASMLTFTKTDSPKYPYFNWLLEYTVSDAQRFRLKEVLMLLGDRVSGQRAVDLGPDGAARKRLLDMGLPEALIDGKEPPTKEEILEALRLATGMKHEFKLLLLIKALHDQDLHTELSEYATELFGL